MFDDLTVTSARQADARLGHQRARIAQRHLQFGRHCRLDVGGLLSRAGHVRVASLVGVAVDGEDIATAFVQRSSARASDCHRVQGPASLGDLVARDTADGFPYREWVATLPDRTNVVVSDWCAAPSPLGLEKAVSIVQSRAYLEHRARLLLPLFGNGTKDWRLATIDFASAARRHGCEFLMCFAAQDSNGVPSITSPSLEIGFALPESGAMDPVFVLTVATFGEARCALLAPLTKS